jgi:dethiobiotin synthetase
VVGRHLLDNHLLDNRIRANHLVANQLLFNLLPARVRRRSLTGMARPRRVVAVVGTGTDIGKTWISAHLLTRLRAADVSVSARKPAQSYDPEDDPAGFDAAILGAASGEAPDIVCAPHRWYERALAPPMAAEALGRPWFTIDNLVDELVWRGGDIGLVETAGGLRSPLAADGDCLAFCRAISPDVVLVVADAELGTINSVRLTVDALAPQEVPVIVVLNRFDPDSDLHVRNLDWLRDRDQFAIVTMPGEMDRLVNLIQD